ncbi:helicase [Candidatus Saccharibacteria bacterium]|nr:helicase [Candidatus Saccharibacteria bacterium]
MSRFITNKENGLSVEETIKNVTEKSESLDFLVGYFFFSGYTLLSDSIKEKSLRILVGLDADVNAKNCIREFEEFSQQKEKESKATIKNRFLETVEECINKTDSFDSKENSKSFKLFKEKLLNGTLEVRKTKDPNHAKMYVFNFDEKNSVKGLEKGKIIVGSSNFSYQGLKGRNEINLYLQDPADYEDGKRIFDELWKDSITLVDRNSAEDFLKKLEGHTWFEYLPTPYLMYIRVLDEYFKENTDVIRTPKDITKDRLNQFFDVSYQTDAIRDGLYKIRKHSGCIVADVVGLGKSVIASTIAANLNLNTIIVCPPHLKNSWNDYASDFGLRGVRIYTPGKLEDAAKENEGIPNQLIIIDEAHRYRNEKTANYGYLSRLCANNKVILLSATPFNNQPADIFSLIKLFQIATNSTIHSVEDLGAQMHALVKEYEELKKKHKNKKINEKEFSDKANTLATEIRNLLDPVVIRRTRIDLEKIQRYRKDLKSQHIQFAKVNPPRSIEYELGNLSEIYKDTLDKIMTRYHATRYKPLTYIKEGREKKYSKFFDVDTFRLGQRNMAIFMRQLFVRRFESCKESFKNTVKNMLESMENIKSYLVNSQRIPLFYKGKLPDYDDIENLVHGDGSPDDLNLFDSEILIRNDEKHPDKGFIFISADDLAEEYSKDLDSDIALFKQFLANWGKIDADPKFDETLKQIRESLVKEKNRKLVIFTEYSDTAEYLFKKLNDCKIRVFLYTSRNGGKTRRDELCKNFDAGCAENFKQDNYDVLVATDAISEGINLHRAGTIYNYDIPYNPTRVIQRVGRINRINKKVFDELFIYNFFPSAIGEEVSRTAEISTFKMKLFEAILGSDTQILRDDETIEGYLGKQFVQAENAENTESWDVPYRNELDAVPEAIKEKASEIPYRCRIRRNEKNIEDFQILEGDLFSGLTSKGVLLFSKKGDSYRFVFADHSGTTRLLPASLALPYFKASIDEDVFPVSDDFYALYENAKSESGIIHKSAQKSRSVQNVVSILNFIKKQSQNESDKAYIDALQNVVSLDSLPLYYIKEIKEKIKPDSLEAATQLRLIVPDTYLDSLLEKNSKVGKEVEMILLSEEFLNTETINS